jgi:hypothetical protein
MCNAAILVLFRAILVLLQPLALASAWVLQVVALVALCLWVLVAALIAFHILMPQGVPVSTQHVVTTLWQGRWQVMVMASGAALLTAAWHLGIPARNF